MPLHVRERQPRQPPLLGFIDGVGRMAGVVAGAGLDLDEDDRAAIDGDQVELADVVAMAAGDDHVAELAQIAGGSILAAAAERLGRETATTSLGEWQRASACVNLTNSMATNTWSRSLDGKPFVRPAASLLPASTYAPVVSSFAAAFRSRSWTALPTRSRR